MKTLPPSLTRSQIHKFTKKCTIQCSSNPAPSLSMFLLLQHSLGFVSDQHQLGVIFLNQACLNGLDHAGVDRSAETPVRGQRYDHLCLIIIFHAQVLGQSCKKKHFTIVELSYGIYKQNQIHETTCSTLQLLTPPPTLFLLFLFHHSTIYPPTLNQFYYFNK